MKTAEEFWEMVDRTPGPGRCHPWKGRIRKSKAGALLYGQVYWQGRCRGAHVVAFTLANGRPPKPGMHVMHKCDFPPCCNPECLVEGTPGQNWQDMQGKGRAKNGSINREKTHCSNNHEYTVQNTRWSKGRRWCRQCDKDRSQPGSARVERRNRNRQERRQEMRKQGMIWAEILRNS